MRSRSRVRERRRKRPRRPSDEAPALSRKRARASTRQLVVRRAAPSVLNMPDRAAYDALSNEQQRRGIDCTLPFFYGPATLWIGLGSWACCPPNVSPRRGPRDCRRCGGRHGHSFPAAEGAPEGPRASGRLSGPITAGAALPPDTATTSTRRGTCGPRARNTYAIKDTPCPARRGPSRSLLITTDRLP